MEHTELTFQSIYNTLLAEKRVVLRFNSPEEAEAFRIKLHKYKSRQDILLEGIGMRPEEERAVLSNTRATDSKTGFIISIFEFKPAKKPLYEVVILDEGEETGLENLSSTTPAT